MSRHVDTGSTDQTIVFWAFDSSGAAVEVTTSDAVSYRVDTNGREGTPVALTLVARTVAGQHRDSAITYKGDGKHEIDLPDAAVASAGEVTLEVTKSGVASVYVEKLEVAAAVATLANQTIIIDGIGYTLAQVQGSVASPQTSTPAYATSFNGATYTVTHTGVTSTGVRGTATRSKS